MRLLRIRPATPTSVRCRLQWAGNMSWDRTTERARETRSRRLAARDRAGYETQPIGPDEFEKLIAAQADAMRELPDPRE